MVDSKYRCHIRFVDIAGNPYLLSLYEGFKTFMPNAEWWILDENNHCYPFAEEKKSPVSPKADWLQQKDEIAGELRAAYPERRFAIRESSAGFLYGATYFCFRDQQLGGIGISNIPSSQKYLLENLLRILDGYMTLLAGAIEDHDDLELMHNIWAETITMIDLNVLLERVTDEICSVLNLDKGIIFLINEDGEFYPAYIRKYSNQLYKNRNLDITRYDYEQPMSSPIHVLRVIPEEDPLRKWLLKALKTAGEPLAANPVCLAIPFYRNTYLIGMFLALTVDFQPISENRHSLLRLLATGGAAAMDNALTLERMNQRRKALSTIHVVHRLMSSRISTKELVPKIGQLVKQLLKVKKCAIMLCNKEKDKLIPKVALGLENNEVGQTPLNFGEELPGWVAENFNPIVYHPGGSFQRPWAETGNTYPAESYMAVALFDTDIEGVIIVADKEIDFTPGDREILLTFAEQVIIAIKNARLYEGERIITVKALQSIANLIETHDPCLAGITAKTREWSVKIATVLNLPESDIRHLVLASLLHDSGMLRSIQPDLSIHEQQRRGPFLSKKFVESLGLPPAVADMVFYVNEAWNGQGFPEGLKGNAIPLGSRIIAVANMFVQLLSRQTPAEKALKIINRFKNRAFDPDVVNALVTAINNPPSYEEE